MENDGIEDLREHERCQVTSNKEHVKTHKLVRLIWGDLLNLVLGCVAVSCCGEVASIFEYYGYMLSRQVASPALLMCKQQCLGN